MLLLKNNYNIINLTELPMLGDSCKSANLLLFYDRLAEFFLRLL